MPFSFTRSSRSNAERFDAGSQQRKVIQPQNTYKRFKLSLSRLFHRSRHDTTQVPGSNIIALEIQQTDPNGHEQHANTVNMHADGMPFATSQLEGAQGFTISGNPMLTNIGVNTGVNNVTTVNHYGGTHGLENLKEFVSFAALHDSYAQDPGRRCYPGTREYALKQMRDWIDNPNATNRIFWLYGPAGAGKSAIAQTIAHGYKKGEVAATFFFHRSDPGRNDGNRLFTTITWQLAFSILGIKDLVVHALDKTPRLPTKDVETQFEQLVAHPFRPVNDVASRMLHPAPVIIIDGIDECSNEQLQQRFLAIIGNAIKDRRVPLRFLISSRPEALIEETLNRFKDFTCCIDLATLDDSNRDIETYIVAQFSEVASKQGLGAEWPGQEIIQEIVFKSSGNFILASVIIRFVSDADYSAQAQLDIVRNLKPHGKTSPFALLDELYLEILKQQRDQEFLKTFLALLVGRSSIESGDDTEGKFYEDDAILMNVSKRELQIKLRRMRSLLKFEPFIDVYHKSFLDFLQDSSRSGEYHVSKQGGLRQYLALIVDSVIRHVSMAIEKRKGHKGCRSSPEFKFIVRDYPSKIVLPVEDWQEALKPLLDLQDKFLNIPKFRRCRVTQILRDLLLHLAILQKKSQSIVAARVPESSRSATVTKWNPAPVAETEQNIPNKDLDNCLFACLSCLQNTNSVLAIDAAIVDHMSSLLAFDYAESVARIRSMSDAQKLMNIIDLLTRNESLLNQCGTDAGRKATYLASEILARVPLFPQSFLNGSSCHDDEPFRFTLHFLELVCQTAFISRILDQTYILPVLRTYSKGGGLRFVGGKVNERNESIHQWLKSSNPSFVIRIRVILEVAKVIRFLHSMDIALFSRAIKPKSFALDSNLRAKVLFIGLFARWPKEASKYDHEKSTLLADCTYKANIIAFGDLFHKVCFGDHDETLPKRLVKDAKDLIKRCCAEGLKSQPTMEEVVKEMERWNLT